MLKRTIKRWFREWREEPTQAPHIKRGPDEWLYSHGPMMQVYPIENGFVARWYTPLGDTAALTYCKDAKEIAETIIAQIAKTKLGLPTHPISGKSTLSGGVSSFSQQTKLPF